MPASTGKISTNLIQNHCRTFWPSKKWEISKSATITLATRLLGYSLFLSSITLRLRFSSPNGLLIL